MNIIKKTIPSFDDINLSLRIHEVGSPIWIIVVHGLGEHQGRHLHLIDLLGQDFNLAFFDLRGHGVSEGDRGDIESFNHYLQDLHAVKEYLKKDYGLNEFILFGHSMGGLIVSRFIQEYSEASLKGVFLSSPALGVDGAISLASRKLPRGIFNTLANLPVGVALKGVLDLRGLSHNPLVYRNYIRDPLNTLRINTKVFLKIINEGIEAQEKAKKISVRVDGAIGTQDPIVSSRECQKFFDSLLGPGKLKQIEGAFHELHNEVEDYKEPYLRFLSKKMLSYRYHDN